MFRNLTSPCRSLSLRFFRFGTTQRFCRDEDGSAAVEFGMVAIPFLALLFAIIQTAMVFLGTQILETANGDAARLIMTGQAQSQSFNATMYRDSVCSRVKGLMDCANVSIDVKSYPTFAAADFSKPVDAKGDLAKATFAFNPGSAGDIVVVRAMYELPILVKQLGLIDLALSDMPGGKRLLIATAAFRNEPYK